MPDILQLTTSGQHWFCLHNPNHVLHWLLPDLDATGHSLDTDVTTEFYVHGLEACRLITSAIQGLVLTLTLLTIMSLSFTYNFFVFYHLVTHVCFVSFVLTCVLSSF